MIRHFSWFFHVLPMLCKKMTVQHPHKWLWVHPSVQKRLGRGVCPTHCFIFFALRRYEKGTCHTFAQIMFCPADVKHTVTYLLQYLFKQVKTRLIFFKGLAQQKVAPTSWESCTILHHFTNRFGGRGSNSWTTSLTTCIQYLTWFFEYYAGYDR